MNNEKIPASQWQSMQVTEEHLTFKFNQHLHKVIYKHKILRHKNEER
jgi:hypothetical protein